MNTVHIEQDDLALFSLRLLSPEESEAIEQHLAVCPLCADELKSTRSALAVYALTASLPASLTAEPAAVPAAARSRFLSALAAEAGIHSAETPTAGVSSATVAGTVAEAATVSPASFVHGTAYTTPAGPSSLLSVQPRRGSRVLPWVSIVGWAAAAACLVVAIGLKQDRDALRSALSTQNSYTAKLEAEALKARHLFSALSDPSAVRVNLTLPKALATPSARATYQQSSGALLLQASNLAPLGEQKVYELWLIPANGDAPVPAGTFTPDAHGNAGLLVPALHGAVAAKAFGITVEHTGGSATPTMPILLAGAPA